MANPENGSSGGASYVAGGFSQPGGFGREVEALMEIAHTNVSRSTVRLLVAFFVAAIALVPAVEAGLTLARGGGGIGVAFSRLSEATAQVGRVFSDEAGGVLSDPASVPSLWRRIVTANHILLNGLTAFERALEDDSVMARTLRPPAQLGMTGGLGAGNERVYPGRDRWLFYRPDVDYLTGRPFLDSVQLKRRVRETPAWEALPQPDPHRAIVAFNENLEARGITLIVMPTPPKAAIHPEKLAGRSAQTIAPENLSFRAFVDRLERDGVIVFTPHVLGDLGSGAPQYLATDTHWRPEAMETVAERLGAFIAARVKLDPVDDPRHRIERVEATNIGDTARMLDLPDRARLFPPETVWLRRVLQADGSLWRSSRTADVLVLGDSFSNIYALESMGWGTSAGFVEQLSYVLRRPVDRVIQNDEGAFATRAMLKQSPDRLNGKRVVIYQFAERELAFGDWKLIDLGR
jgi:alginate O-acetyltransferase complex protein AlgJ